VMVDVLKSVVEVVDEVDDILVFSDVKVEE
jgi:hypothetical protein